MRSPLAITVLAVGASCAAAPHVVGSTRRLGDAMDEAGLRFERAERAVVAGRWDTARDDVRELDAIFEKDVAPSTWSEAPRVSQLARRFKVVQLAALHEAVAAHDQMAFEQAAAAAARGCTECHAAADRTNIEISPIVAVLR